VDAGIPAGAVGGEVMPAARDLTNQPFGTLVALEIGEPTISGRRRWRCRCACGAEELVCTQLLTSGKVDACRACRGGREPHQVERTCEICGAEFKGDVKLTVCSHECALSKRRGSPPLMKACAICGTEFRVTRGAFVCCSKECLRERRRRRALAQWYRRTERDPDLPKRMAARRRAKALADPEYAAKVKLWEQRKNARHRQRMKSDPVYRERYRQQQARHWKRHAKRIMETRRARMASLPAEELSRLRAKAVEACRRSRMKPGIRERHLEHGAEYRRRRRAEKVWASLAAIQEALAGRLEGAVKVKPCMMCGEPIVGRRATALICGKEECRKNYQQLKQARWRAGKKKT
jgi:hypothetical protein